MTNTTEAIGFTTGFATSWRQRQLTAVPGTAESGRSNTFATISESTTEFGGTTGMRGRLGSRVDSMVSPVVPTGTGNGSGVPADSELALDRGKPLANRVEATRRHYGALGECPRRIPA